MASPVTRSGHQSFRGILRCGHYNLHPGFPRGLCVSSPGVLGLRSVHPPTHTTISSLQFRESVEARCALRVTCPHCVCPSAPLKEMPATLVGAWGTVTTPWELRPSPQPPANGGFLVRVKPNGSFNLQFFPPPLFRSRENNSWNSCVFHRSAVSLP